jgi:hypothetical protein
MRTKLIALLAVLLCLGLSTNLLAGRDALVGKWKATVTNDDTSKDTTDNLEFKGGKFTSENEQADGFEPATYEDDPAPQGMGLSKFSVDLTNKAGDTATWSGTATGNEISGTLVIKKKDGTKTTYTVKATKN